MSGTAVPNLAGENEPLAGAATAADKPWLRVERRDRWRAICVLTLLLILSFIDRNILKLLIEPLRKDLGVTDLQVSLLVGISFSILYSISCVPFGYAADRLDRRKLVGGAVFCWSSMSILCGFAGNYWQLFAGRAGLGIGEAALQPSAASLIRDSFPPEQRARAFSIFGIGPLVGTAFAMLIGGYLYALAEAGAVRDIPFLGSLRPWQFCLVVPGIIGIGLAFLTLALKEPPRPPLGDDRPTFRALFRHMGQSRRAYILLFAAPTLWSLANSGWSAWLAAAIGRTWGISIGEIGKTAGLISLIVTPLGLVGLGFLIEWLTRRGRRDAVFQVTIAVQFINIVPAMMVFMAPSMEMMWWAYGISMLTNGSFQIAASSILTQITPSHLTGKTAALFSMVQNFLGLSIGPTIFALVAAGFFTGERAIVPAMMLCYGLFIALATALMTGLMMEVRRQRRLGSRDFVNS